MIKAEYVGRTIKRNEQVDGRPCHENGYRAYVNLKVSRGTDKPWNWPDPHNVYVRSPLLEVETAAMEWMPDGYEIVPGGSLPRRTV